jgi:hypothetical protein
MKVQLSPVLPGLPLPEAPSKSNLMMAAALLRKQAKEQQFASLPARIRLVY